MNRRIPAIVIVTAVTLALFALYHLLLLQYESGDAYPEYSSFRADPLGLLILHDAVASAKGTAPQRNLAPLDRATFPVNSTLLLAGARVSKDEVATLERIEAYVKAGGRFVVLFQPNQAASVNSVQAEKQKKEEKEKKKSGGNNKDAGKEEKRQPGQDEEDMMNALVPRADISERWGFEYSTLDLPTDAKNQRGVNVRRGQLAPEKLPERLLWHSDLIFTDVAPEWTVVYERGSHPVVIERAWGEGRIVVSTDNYLVSNEAMLKDRAPAFLAWLTGSSRTLVFEETHLGVVLSTGVMTLARKYGLIPMLVSGILLTLLFIWRNGAPLVPKRPEQHSGSSVVAAHSTVGGLASLVRRAIKPDEILETSWRLFQVPTMRRPAIDKGRRDAVEAALAAYKELPSRLRDAASTYNQISAIINERKANP